MEEFTGLIFDFNGVLLFDSHLHEKAWRGYSEELRGFSFTEYEMRENVHGRTNQAILEYLTGRKLTDKEVSLHTAGKESRYRAFCRAADDFKLSPGTPELLDELCEMRMPMTIATASERSNLDFFIERLELGRWFDLEQIVYDDGTIPGKPAPDIYARAAGRLGLPPEDCIVIEDSLSGIRSAERAGIGRIYGLGPAANRELLLDEPGVFDVLESPDQLPREILSGAADLIIRPLMVGVCRSDLKELSGELSSGSYFGHELAGEVEYVREGLQLDLESGQRVTFNPNIKGLKRNSGFSERWYVRGAAEDLRAAFMSANPAISPDRLIFQEPLACAVHSVGRLGQELGRRDFKGLRIAVGGAGLAGALTALVLRASGARVQIYNRSPERLEFLKETGLFADPELHLDGRPGQGENEFDGLILTTTRLDPLQIEKAMARLDNGGVLLLFGGTAEGDTLGPDHLDVNRLRRDEGCVKYKSEDKTVILAGTHGANQNDFRGAERLLVDFPEVFPLEKLITRRTPLAAAPEMFQELLREGYVGKVAVEVLKFR